jgi:hypothetical protein
MTKMKIEAKHKSSVKNFCKSYDEISTLNGEDMQFCIDSVKSCKFNKVITRKDFNRSVFGNPQANKQGGNVSRAEGADSRPKPVSGDGKGKAKKAEESRSGSGDIKVEKTKISTKTKKAKAKAGSDDVSDDITVEAGPRNKSKKQLTKNKDEIPVNGVFYKISELRKVAESAADGDKIVLKAAKCKVRAGWLLGALDEGWKFINSSFVIDDE